MVTGPKMVVSVQLLFFHVCTTTRTCMPSMSAVISGS